MKKPDATFLEDEFIYVWPDQGIKLVFERFREDRGSLFADAHPESVTDADDFLPPDKLNLGSARSIKQYANTLSERGLLSSDEWFDALSIASAMSVKRYREGEPSVVLADVKWRGKPRHVIAPYIDRHGTTILFGDGAVSKSVHALMFAVSVATGVNVLPNSEVRMSGPVLYLDWEADDETHAERLEAICLGLGIEPPKNLHYMRRAGSIASSVREIRREIATCGVVFAVVDSVGAASAGDPESAQAVISVMNAIRAFGVPTLAIHHIAKDAKDKSKPFGSVYAPNLARRTWRLDKEQTPGEDGIYVRAIHFKANNGRLEESRSHRVGFLTDQDDNLTRIDFGTGTPGRMPRTHTETGLKWPIAEELRTGPLTLKELALALDAREDTVRKTLRRWTDWFVQVGDTWALLDREHDGTVDSSVRNEVSEQSGQYTPSPYRGGVRGVSVEVGAGEEGPDW